MLRRFLAHQSILLKMNDLGISKYYSAKIHDIFTQLGEVACIQSNRNLYYMGNFIFWFLYSTYGKKHWQNKEVTILFVILAPQMKRYRFAP